MSWWLILLMIRRAYSDIESTLWNHVETTLCMFFNSNIMPVGPRLNPMYWTNVAAIPYTPTGFLIRLSILL